MLFFWVWQVEVFDVFAMSGVVEQRINLSGEQVNNRAGLVERFHRVPKQLDEKNVFDLFDEIQVDALEIFQVFDFRLVFFRREVIVYEFLL